MWTFRCYISAEGVDVVRQWYDSVPDDVRGAMDATIEILQASKREWWRWPAFRELKSDACEGLCSIRIVSNDDHHRILGFFGPDAETEFSLLKPFHKSAFPDYTPACKCTHERRLEVINSKDRSHVCAFP